MAVTVSNPEPREYSNILTMPSEMPQGANWGEYTAGQEIDATDWDPQQIKDFRDQYGATYSSDNFNNQFTQYSLDYLGGKSLYDFQWDGTGDQWASMYTSPEMNKWYKGYGVNEGDIDAGLSMYNYYDGTEYDEAGNVTKQGTGKNDISKQDVFTNYESIGDIIGTEQSAMDAFQRGFLEDMEIGEDGSLFLDNQKSGDVGDADVGLANAKMFQAFNKSASDAGAMEDRPGTGEIDQERMSLYETMKNDPFAGEYATEPLTRELGRVYGEPNIDPDLRPNDMWDSRDINQIGTDAGLIGLYDRQGEEVRSWEVTSPNENSNPFNYTEGSLDNPYGDPSLESFQSAIALMGNELQETNLPGEIYNPARANETSPSGILENQLDKNGNPIQNFGWGGGMDVVPRTYTDEFIEAQMQDGGVLGSPVRSLPDDHPLKGSELAAANNWEWTPTSELASANGWTAEDYRVYANAAANHNNNWAGEERALRAVEAARKDREAGYNRPPQFYSAGIMSALGSPLQAIGEFYDPNLPHNKVSDVSEEEQYLLRANSYPGY